MKKIPRSNIQFISRDEIDDDNDTTKETTNKDNSPSIENSVSFDIEDEEKEDDVIDNDQDKDR